MNQMKELFSNRFNIIYQEINNLNPESKDHKSYLKVYAPKMDSSKLKDPPSGPNQRRGKSRQIVKKIYKGGIEVARKPFFFPEKDENLQFVHRYLSILGKLHESPNILKFYGLSTEDNKSFTIFEWAEMGNLKEFYEGHDIPWDTKANIAFDICSGIVFLNALNIYHHDIRCENIMVNFIFINLISF